MNAVLANPAFLQTLTTQEILLIKCVSGPWAAWFADNVTTIALSRRQDESVDWYFPLLDKKIVPPQLWEMTGMWHAGAEYSSETKLCTLPATGYEPPRTCFCDLSRSHFVKVVVASGGGLLMTKSGASGKHGHRINHNTECVRNGRQLRNRLMVTNPLTNQCKVLPAFQGGLGHAAMSSYFKHHHFIVVDDTANTYKVLIFRSSRLDVYDSKSNTWNSFRDVLSSVQPSLGTWSGAPHGERIYSAVCMGGCLYIADIREATSTEISLHREVMGAIRLFEVDIETGEWKLCNEILVCRINPPFVQGLQEGRAWNVLRNLELVESMGQLHAVIPARIDQLLYVYKPKSRPRWNAAVKNFSFMPLQFYVFRLNGGDGRIGRIRMEVPVTQKTTLRVQSLRKKTFSTEFAYARRLTPKNNWFACVLKGNVIWLTVEDYLVGFDLLSWECKTEILEKPEGTETVVGLPYRASFHMKP